MAKNIVIQTDGTAVTYSGVKEIETNDPEEGRVTWIPMDETELAIKTVNQNGTYKASSDGYYGYRQFTVSTKNKGKTVGTKPDGRTYAVDTDDDGFLTETLLPDNIRINPQPTKTTYSDGESISLSGAVVKAYSKDDIWEGEGYSGGVIPHSELTLEPTTASGSGGSGERQATSDLNTNWEQPITLYSGASRQWISENSFVRQTITDTWTLLGNAVLLIRYFTATDISFTIASPTSGEIGKLTRVTQSYDKDTHETTTTTTETIYSSADSYTYNGQTVHSYTMGSAVIPNNAEQRSPSNVPTKSEYADNATIWTAVYGNISGGGATDKVNVKWNRPEDDEELKTSFNISLPP